MARMGVSLRPSRSIFLGASLKRQIGLAKGGDAVLVGLIGDESWLSVPSRSRIVMSLIGSPLTTVARSAVVILGRARIGYVGEKDATPLAAPEPARTSCT
jgi:hypothetical protein